MILEDLPQKTLQHLIKSVTWTTVAAESPTRLWLRRFIERLAQPRRWFMLVRKRTHRHHERLIDRRRMARNDHDSIVAHDTRPTDSSH